LVKKNNNILALLLFFGIIIFVIIAIIQFIKSKKGLNWVYRERFPHKTGKSFEIR